MIMQKISDDKRSHFECIHTYDLESYGDRIVQICTVPPYEYVKCNYKRPVFLCEVIDE